MNRKQLLVLLALGLLLGGLGFYLTRARHTADTTRSAGVGQKLLGDFPLNDIAHVTLKDSTGAVNLVRGEVWTVQERHNYPASFTEISEFVRKLWELKPVQSQPVGRSQWARLDLLAPGPDAGTNAATLVELKGKDGQVIRSLLLGKKYLRDSGGGDQFGGGGFPVGRFLAVPSEPDVVFVTSETFSDVEATPDHWLNKDFFKVEKLRAISLISTNATNNWSLNRTNETAEWILADLAPDQELDKSKTSSLNWAFSSPSFNDVLPGDTAADVTGLDQPTILKLETFDNFAYTVRVGSKTNDDTFFVTVATTADLPKERTAAADEKPEDKEAKDKEFKERLEKEQQKLKKEQALEKWIYKVSKWTVDSVLKDRAHFLAEKKADPAATNAPPESIALPAAGAEVPAEIIPPLAPPADPPPKE